MLRSREYGFNAARGSEDIPVRASLLYRSLQRPSFIVVTSSASHTLIPRPPSAAVHIPWRFPDAGVFPCSFLAGAQPHRSSPIV